MQTHDIFHPNLLMPAAEDPMLGQYTLIPLRWVNDFYGEVWNVVPGLIAFLPRGMKMLRNQWRLYYAQRWCLGTSWVCSSWADVNEKSRLSNLRARHSQVGKPAPKPTNSEQLHGSNLHPIHVSLYHKYQQAFGVGQWRRDSKIMPIQRAKTQAPRI